MIESDFFVLLSIMSHFYITYTAVISLVGLHQQMEFAHLSCRLQSQLNVSLLVFPSNSKVKTELSFPGEDNVIWLKSNKWTFKLGLFCQTSISKVKNFLILSSFDHISVKLMPLCSCFSSL